MNAFSDSATLSIVDEINRLKQTGTPPERIVNELRRSGVVAEIDVETGTITVGMSQAVRTSRAVR